DDVARLRGLAHEVEHALLRLHVEVEIVLGAPVVQVTGHGVPDAARLEGREAHEKLRRPADIRMDVLMDRALVAGFRRAHFRRPGLVDRDLQRLEPGVSRRADEVILGGSRRIFGLERDTGALLADIEPVAGLHSILPAVDSDASRATDVDHAELAPREK